MEVKTFRAKTVQDALRLVHHELGPDAHVLTTDKKPANLWSRLTGQRVVEVTALSEASAAGGNSQTHCVATSQSLQVTEPLSGEHYRSRFRQFAMESSGDSLLESLIEQDRAKESAALPSSLFRLFNDLLHLGVDERFAQAIVEDVHRHSTPAELGDFHLVRSKVEKYLENRISTTPQIGSPTSESRVVALVGPTGVGKTTTVAKIAANLRLRDKRRVGLITVDTYRIAAIEQLRAYADIIDLPMEVVTTPREMRDAVQKLSDLDFVLIDTAGRSPHDEIQIQELRAMLSEARADEVQLVLSATANARHLTRLTEQFRSVETTSLLNASLVLTWVHCTQFCHHLVTL